MSDVIETVLGAALPLLPLALSELGVPAPVVAPVRSILGALAPLLARLTRERLAAEQLPALPDVQGPSLGGAIQGALDELGVISPMARTEPPPAPDTERTTEP